MKLKIIALLGLFWVCIKANDSQNWWKTAVIYQIYPRSFKDSNNDGNGDLQGIIEKIDHFSETGINVVWLSPFFQSPQVDQGYDISDYRKVDPLFGTLKDLSDLIKLIHEKGLKIIFDFVPNHTSDQHEWFQKSVRRIHPYTDYYVWANGSVSEKGERQPPNNWVSVFKNSAWTWNEERQQYYLHQFVPAQPDLNFRNPLVVKELEDVMVFWMDYGVDGFRVDAVPHIFEDNALLDEPESGTPGQKPTDYGYLKHIYTFDQPETYELIYEWRKFIDDYSAKRGGNQRVFITECYTSLEHTMLYYGTSNGSKLGAHFSFNFNLLTYLNSKSNATNIVEAVTKWLNAIPENYVSNWVLGNHDNHRVASRFGLKRVDGYNMLMALLPGVGITYNGEEIGMEDGEVSYEEGQDPSARNKEIFEKVSRDFERTPYQWNNTTNAGFNKGAKTWLPVSQKYLKTNLADQKFKPKSHFKVYQKLMELRKTPVLKFGTVEIKEIEENVVYLKRCFEKDCLILIFNNGNSAKNITIKDKFVKTFNVVLASVDSKMELGGPVNLNNLPMEENEAIILQSS